VLATQYSIPLPADYDMGVIRRRVAERGHLLDDLPGLGLKAYLVQDRSKGGLRNAYAPFYLWTDTGAAASFLWGGGGFAGIVRDFGRPAVSTWLGVGFAAGPAALRAPVRATLRRRSLAPDEDPAAEAERLRETIDAQARHAGVHSVAAAIDPAGWDAVVFTLHAEAAHPIDGATDFEVLHLSTPDLAALAPLAAVPSGGRVDGGR
jgi:hypothetical protein